MKDDVYLQEGFRKPEPEKPDPYYYVCGGRYTYKELDAEYLSAIYKYGVLAKSKSILGYEYEKRPTERNH